MKRKIVFIQNDASSCGACSIASILSFHKGYVPLEKIREDTRTDKNGTNAYELVRVLKKYGFDSYGLNINLDNINKKYLPVIAHVIKDGYEHFLVIYKITDRVILTMDPEVGEKIYSRDEFKNIFDNNIILAIPSGQIIKMNKSTSLKKLFFQTIKPRKKIFLMLFIIGSLSIYINLVINLYLRWIMNSNKVIYFTTCCIVLICLKFILTVFKSIMESKTALSIKNEINSVITSHIFKLRIRYLNSKRVGEIVQKVQDAFQIENLFTKIILITSMDIVLFIFGMLFLMTISFMLGSIVWVLLIIYTINIFFINKKIHSKEKKVIDRYNNYSGNLVEYLKGLESIKNLNKTNLFLKNLHNSFNSYMKERFSLDKFHIFNNSFKSFIFEICFIAINFLGFYLINMDKLVLIDLITFNTVFSLVNTSFLNILNTVLEVIHTKVIFNEISEFLDVSEERNASHIQALFECLKCFNLNYSYDHFHNTISNFNLSIKKGDKILIQGSSGSGKSTFVKCLSGQLDEYDGLIQINNINIRAMSINCLREYVIYVGQNENLFSGSIKDNICLGEYDDLKFKNVIKITCVDQIINNKINKENTKILEDASNISGGEKARIILARALYKNVPIIIIDETLSSVSEDMENEILNNLLNLKDLTLLYITHRNKQVLFQNRINFRKDCEYELN